MKKEDVARRMKKLVATEQKKANRSDETINKAIGEQQRKGTEASHHHRVGL